MMFGSISPSADCSKYPINLDPTTNINKIARMPKVDLKTSIFMLLKRIFLLYMPCEL